MKKLDLVLAWILVVLGFLEAAVIFRGPGWGLAGSIAVVEAGFLNVIRNASSRGVISIAAILCNVLMLIAIVPGLIHLIGAGRILSAPLLLGIVAVLAIETIFSMTA